jgi:hypothetical protein
LLEGSVPMTGARDDAMIFSVKAPAPVRSVAEISAILSVSIVRP